ncbi:single-stranded DNA-binding protein [Streptomyces sp. O3]
MSDTMVTLVGNVASEPRYREQPSGGVTRFRLAVTARRYDRVSQVWRDSGTSFFTVWARRTLAANVASCVTVGEPVVVHGRLRVWEREAEDRRWLSADVDAVTVGHDLSRGTAAFRRVSRAAAPELTERPAADAGHSPRWEQGPEPAPPPDTGPPPDTAPPPDTGPDLAPAPDAAPAPAPESVSVTTG